MHSSAGPDWLRLLQIELAASREESLAPLVRALGSWVNDYWPAIMIAQFHQDQQHNDGKQHCGTSADSCFLPLAAARHGGIHACCNGGSRSCRCCHRDSSAHFDVRLWVGEVTGVFSGARTAGADRTRWAKLKRTA